MNFMETCKTSYFPLLNAVFPDDIFYDILTKCWCMEIWIFTGRRLFLFSPLCRWAESISPFPSLSFRRSLKLLGFLGDLRAASFSLEGTTVFSISSNFSSPNPCWIFSLFFLFWSVGWLRFPTILKRPRWQELYVMQCNIAPECYYTFLVTQAQHVRIITEWIERLV